MHKPVYIDDFSAIKLKEWGSSSNACLFAKRLVNGNTSVNKIDVKVQVFFDSLSCF